MIGTQQIAVGKTFGMDMKFGLQSLYQVAGNVSFVNGKPTCQIYVPIFDNFHDNWQMAAMMLVIITWDNYWSGILPILSSKPIICVLESLCR